MHRYRHGLCRNARAGAAPMAEPWVRKHIPSRFGRLFPRTKFHLVYLRRFGVRGWLLDGCPMRAWDEIREDVA